MKQGKAPKPMLRKDVTGKRFGRLVAKERICWDDGLQRTIWRCACECGEEAHVPLQRLTSGQVQSCGCSRRTAGGNSNIPEYNAWRYLRKQGLCPDCWASYAQFWADMGSKPKGSALVRADENLPHGPGNSVWGKRIPPNSHRITCNGITDSLNGWCNRLYVWHYDVKKRQTEKNCTVQEAIASIVKEKEL